MRTAGIAGAARAWLIAAVLVTVAAPQALASGLGGPVHEPGSVIPGEVVVRFENPARVGAQADRIGGALGDRLGVPGMVTVEVDQDADPVALAKRLSDQPGVAWAEPNTWMELTATPNDPLFAQQWGLLNTGQAVRGFPGVAGFDANATGAWDATKGGDVLVAVVDSGVAFNHPDLAPNLWTNPGETGLTGGGIARQSNGIDDDSNGFIDDWRGWDFISSDNNPTDLNGHGTHMAGIIGAAGNNGAGGTGVNWQADVLALRVGGTNRFDGAINAAAAAQAFAYAGSRGAKVVSAGFSGGAPTQAQEDAIAAYPNTLFVTPAGNSASNNDISPQYPCNFQQPNIICVAAIDNRGLLADRSNFGQTRVDLGAPGGGILAASPFSTVLDESFETSITGRWQRVALPVNAPNNWEVGPSGKGDGTKAVSPNGAGAYPINSNTGITSPPINFSGCTAPALELDYSVDFPTGNGTFEIYLSSTATPTGPTVQLIGASAGNVSQQRIVLDPQPALTALGTSTAYLFFNSVTSGATSGRGPRIDDVTITCTPAVPAAGDSQFRSGTSQAAAMVAGAAALVESRKPGSGPAALKSAILNSVTPTASLTDTVTGGRLNIAGAVGPPSVTPPDTTPPALQVDIPKKLKKSVIAKKGFKVGCSLGEAGTCEVEVGLAKGAAKDLGIKGLRAPKFVTIARGRADVPASGQATVVAKPPSKTRKAIKRAKGKLKFQITVTGADVAGNATTTKVAVKSK